MKSKVLQSFIRFGKLEDFGIEVVMFSWMILGIRDISIRNISILSLIESLLRDFLFKKLYATSNLFIFGIMSFMVF